MPGSIVPLYLCKTCKGLFVFESQAENHLFKCNGDAFKSPANLFVCEREQYLELVSPTPSVVAPKASKKCKNRLVCERKRRKTSPQISCTSETKITERSFLSKDDLSTLTPGSYCGMISPQVRGVNGKAVPRSHSHPQTRISCHGNTVNNMLHSNTCSTAVQRTSQQNVLNAIVSLSAPASQSFVFTGNADDNPSCFSPTKTVVSFSSRSKSQGADSEDRGSGDTESVLMSKNSTPATNLLAYLSQLQQDGNSPVLQTTVHAGKEEQFPSLVPHSAPLDRQSNLYAVLDGNPAVAANVLESKSHQSPIAGTSEQNQHVDILAGDILKIDDFQFKTVAAANNGNEIHHCRQLLDESVYKHDINEFLPFGSSVCVEGDKPAQINRSLETPALHVETRNQAYTELPVSTSDRTRLLKEDEKQMAAFENTKIAQSFQTECSSSSTVHVFDSNSTETDVSEASSNQGGSMPGSVVLFVEPVGNIIQTVAVENVLNNSTDTNSSLGVPTGMNADNIKLCDPNGLQVTVCEPAVPSRSEHVSSCQVTLSKPASKSDCVNTNCGRETSHMGSFGSYGKGVIKTKTKTQIRLEELSALREEVLLQAREISVEGEAKKFHYSCNVCGHVAKSVKFMHNHLQMHADGKVYFECDQCDFKSRLRSKLAEHQQRHTRSRLLCHLCPATFMDLASLNRHVTAKHTNNEDLKCDQCDFKASYASLLREHTLKHTGDLLCCEVKGCNYKTPYQRALRVHQKRHSCEKNYHCHLCSYEAVEKSTLDRHIKSHTQERPYQCSCCDFRANTRYSVVVHMQHKHQPQKSFYACDQCSFYTSYASSIAKHLKSHLSTFTCPLCNHSTHTLSAIKKHLHQVHQVVNMEVVENKTQINAKDYLRTQCDNVLMESHKPLMESDKPLTESDKSLMESDKPLREADKALMEADKALTESDKGFMESDKILTESDKGFMESDKALTESDRALESLMADTMNIDSQDLPPLPLTDVDRSCIDPMKLSFHFQDSNPGPIGSGTNLTRSSSIPDFSTFAGMNQSNSQSDLLAFPGISTVTRSNSMSDLLSFATSICMEGGEAVNMDVSLSDASAPSMEVGGLSVEEGEGSLSEDVRVGSLGGVLLAFQCSKCLTLLMNEEDVENHKKSCRGPVLVV